MKKKLAVLLSLLLVVAMLTISCAQIQKIVDQLPDEVVDVIPGVEKTTIPEGAVKYSEVEDGVSIAADDKTKLPETLVIPKKNGDADVVDIAASAFDGCTGIKKVTIPDSIATIGTYAFRDCSALEEVVFPEEEGPAIMTILMWSRWEAMASAAFMN